MSLEDKINKLDYKNKSIVRSLIDSLSEMEADSKREFTTIQIVNKIKLNRDLTCYHYENTLKKCDSIRSLDLQYAKMLDAYNELNSIVDDQHNANLEAIKNNMLVRNQIDQLMDHIGVRKDYSTIKLTGSRIKETKHMAGYLSDMEHFCVIDDGYNNIKSTLKNELNSLEGTHKQHLLRLKNIENQQLQYAEFQSINRVMVEHAVFELDSEFDLFKLKTKVIAKYDPEVAIYYENAIAKLIIDGEDNDIEYCMELEDGMIIHHILTDMNIVANPLDTDVLKSRYSVYKIMFDKTYGKLN